MGTPTLVPIKFVNFGLKTKLHLLNIPNNLPSKHYTDLLKSRVSVTEYLSWDQEPSTKVIKKNSTAVHFI